MVLPHAGRGDSNEPRFRAQLLDGLGAAVAHTGPQAAHELLQEIYDEVSSGNELRSVVLAGDPKQLPPIHQAEPPKGLEAMVGSIYEFVEKVHAIEPTMLDVNYRSNATIVRLAHRAPPWIMHRAMAPR